MSDYSSPRCPRCFSPTVLESECCYQKVSDDGFCARCRDHAVGEYCCVDDDCGHHWLRPAEMCADTGADDE